MMITSMIHLKCVHSWARMSDTSASDATELLVRQVNCLRFRCVSNLGVAHDDYHSMIHLKHDLLQACVNDTSASDAFCVVPCSDFVNVACDDHYSMIHLNHAHKWACLSDTSASDATFMLGFEFFLSPDSAVWRLWMESSER